MKYARIIPLLLLLFTCRFEKITQPASVQPGEIIDISITIYDDVVPEPNPHKGVLCMLVPQDWSFVSGSYDGSMGNGTFEPDTAWADSAEVCFPAVQMGDFMKWIALISDTGYSYAKPITINVIIRLRAGETKGCFGLGYLITKATQDLICTGWSPLSFPHVIGVGENCQPNPTREVIPDSEWDALFDRTDGWTGADGIYSIPLSGRESFTENETERTLFVFSDTFIGTVDANDRRQNARLVNNTYAILHGMAPDPEQIDFYWRVNSSNQPVALFEPETPNASPGDWYWLMDGLVLNDKIHVFGLKLEQGSGGAFNFQINGVTLISFVIDSANAILDCEQVDTPLFYKDPATGSEIVLGQAIMPMTEVSGNTGADGFIYIYGPRSGSSRKELVAARVTPELFEDFDQWRYWDGQSWSEDIRNCATLTTGISQEFSLNPLPDGRFILVYQSGEQVAIKFGESPTGPFAFSETIYHCPEAISDPNILVYNAKAHPHLSKPDELLISYNVNSLSFSDLMTKADIYHPRFIRLRLDEIPIADEQIEELPSIGSAILFQNYPNPFNASTLIRYTLQEPGRVTIKIYNIVGTEIKTLVDSNLTRGNYSVLWDGRSDTGETMSSGLYLYQIQSDSQILSRKLLYLK